VAVVSLPPRPRAARGALEWLRGHVGLRRHLRAALGRPSPTPSATPVPAADGDGPPPVRRLNWSVGPTPVPGWVNVDVRDGGPDDVPGDIRGGLPLEDASVDYAFSLHALAEIPYREVVPVLAELRRVLRPGGALRVVVPDLELLHDAYRRGDASVFEVPDADARRPGAKLVTQLVWHGLNRTVFTYDALEEFLRRAGFSRVERSTVGRTSTPWPDIAALDGRAAVSLFVEAVR